MKLDKITLAGFKSFPDRTSLKVDTGVVAVVGPNGCGKSNIVDAFRWVMGESRATQLRQDTNADIIFSGTTERRASDLCSVELNLLNDGSRDIGMWGQYAELSIRREVERDGDSTYFINGQRVRRKDVVGVFAGTGTGARAYGIVEQDRVTQVVRADPKRIREHLEEAAGVSLYKERRKETESRIGVSQANLARIDDTIAELRRQMDSLAKQVKLTDRVRKQKRRLAAARLLLLLIRHESLRQEHEAASAEARQAKEAAEGIKASCKKLDSELEKVRKDRHKRSDMLNKFQGKHFEAMADQEKARQALREFEASVASDEALLKEADAAVKEHSEKSKELEEAAKSLAGEIEAGDESARSATEEMELSKGQHDDALGKARAAEKLLEEARAALSESQLAQGDATSTMRLAKHRVESLDEAMASAKRDLEGLAPVEKPDEQALEKLRSELAEAIDAAVTNERRRQELGEDIASAKEEAVRLQGVKGGLMAERDLLQRVSGKQAESHAAWLSSSGEDGARRVIEEMEIVAPGFERAVDAALSTYLQGYVVSDAGALLQGDDLPAGIVLVDHKHGGSVAKGRAIEGVRPLVECIKFSKEWRDVIARWLSGIYFAPDLASALRARGDLRLGEMLVTADGACLHDCVARVASEQEAGLEWRSRLAEVEKGLATVDSNIKVHSGKVDKQVSEHERLAKGGERLASARRQAEDIFDRRNQEAIRLGHAIEYREEQDRRLHGVIERTVKDLELRQAELQKAVAADKDASDKATKAAHAVELQEGQFAAVTEKASELRDHNNTLKAAVHRTELTQQHNRQRLDETRERIVEIQMSLSSSRVRIVEVQARMRTRNPSKLDDALRLSSKAVEGAKKELDGVVEGAEELERLQSRHESDNAALRSELEQAEGRQRELEIGAATRSVEVDGIKSQLDAQQDEISEAEALRKEYPDKDTVSGLVERLEVRIDRAGPINYAAEAEMSACESRLEEVSAQREDLAEALDALREAIGRIDSEMLERLKDVHARLKTGFDAMFKRLFDGGSASVELVGDSLLSSGLQLRASPPGKKVSGIQALSGGEKTLTAVAFLFALNELNPPMFCILDEVDAALDEANTVRLYRLIEAMADRMQFIVVTHNKQAIERADRLVGVTQHDKGVSCLVSVQVDQALEQARLAAAGGER